MHQPSTDPPTLGIVKSSFCYKYNAPLSHEMQGRDMCDSPAAVTSFGKRIRSCMEKPGQKRQRRIYLAVVTTYFQTSPAGFLGRFRVLSY